MATTTSSSVAAVIATELRRGADAVLDAVPRLSPNYQRPDHLPREVADFFVGVARGESRRLVFSSGPRFGKSTLNAHGIAWAMFCRPGLSVGVVCCTADKAEDISRQVRELLQHLGVFISKEQRAVDQWVAANGSSLKACGTRSSALIGFGFGLLCLDDLIPSMAAAQSETERTRNEEWIEAVALSRLEPNGSVILCMHRWATDDISGRMIARGWPSVNLPVVDPVTGASNWPARWSTQQLEAKRREVGPLVWEAMYLGNPSPRGGRVFGAMPTFYDPQVVVAEVATRRARILIGVDPAFSSKRAADHSVIAISVITTEIETHEYEEKVFVDPARRHTRTVPRVRHTSHHYFNVVDIVRIQVEAPALMTRIAAEVRRWSQFGSVTLGIESVAGAKAIPQMMRAMDPTMRIVEIPRSVDKLTAALPLSACYADGKLRWPTTNVPWRDQALAEVTSFTGVPGLDASDDVVDGLVAMHGLLQNAEAKAVNARRLRRLASLLPFGA